MTAKTQDPITDVRAELAKRQLCRNRMMPFVKRNVKDYEAGWVHQEICAKLEKFEQDIIDKKSPRLMLFLPPRSGKNLGDRTDIFTYNRGLISHGELQVNDLVQHPSGKPTRVIATSPKYECEYEVTISDGSTFKCNGNHEWTVWDRSAASWRTYDTKWFAATTKFGKIRTLHTGELGKRGSRYKYQLPLVAGPVQMALSEQVLDPYFLGVWLGDGGSDSPSICFDPRKPAHINKIIARGLRNTRRWEHNNTDKYANVSYVYFGDDQVLPKLRELKVFKHKHIPRNYLMASVEQRLELLAGLIDSEGSVNHVSRVSFSNTNKPLIDSYFELCQGLNLRPYWLAPAPPTLSTSGIQGTKTVYEVGFQPPPEPYCPMIPTVVKPITRTVKQRKIAITKVRKVIDEEVEYGHCIQVEAEDGLYLAGKSLTPTHNSELASTQFPAWFLGRNPNKEVISCSYSASLSMSFSRKVRELIRDPKYQSVFPRTILGKDSQSTENWITTEQGGFLAAGILGSITGRGADCLVIDDPIRGRSAAESPGEREAVWDWYSSTAYTRLAPGGGALIILTRWHSDDLAGRLINEMKHKRGDDWEIITYPAVAVHDEKYRKIGEALHPERYDLKALDKIKAALTARDWGALYQQNPSTEEGAIIKRDSWNRWEDLEPPKCEYVIQSYDTAYGQSQTSDFTVITTWGLFQPDGDMAHHTLNKEAHGETTYFSGEETHIILLDVVRGRFPFPELKERAYMLYNYWKPDSIIVEAKASGQPLMQEMRRKGIPVQGFSPSRGNDKMARLHSISDLFTSGYIWAPRNEWADDLVEECHKFPAGKHDDQVDSTTQALMRFRQGGFVTLASDEIWDEDITSTRRRRAYY